MSHGSYVCPPRRVTGAEICGESSSGLFVLSDLSMIGEGDGVQCGGKFEEFSVSMNENIELAVELPRAAR